jgi:hypothetical protein
MWVVYLEMGFALALAVFIVWFTWPKKRDEERDSGKSADDKDGEGPGDAGIK